MRPLALTLAGVFLLGAALRAQQRKVLAEDDKVKVELTKYSETCAVLLTGKENPKAQDANRTCSELAITNKSRAPITAWVAITETDRPGDPRNRAMVGARSSDSLIYPHGNPNDPEILPRDTHRVILGNPTRVDLKAAVFSDGSAFGGPEWVQRIIQNRRHIYQDVAVALQKLRAARGAGTSREQLIHEFSELEKREKAEEAASSRALSGPAAVVLSGISVYATVASNLGRGKASSNADMISQDIDRLESLVLDIGSRLLASKPPIADHPVPLGEPLDSSAPPSTPPQTAPH